MNKIIALDLEISEPIPAGVDDWSTLHPIGIAALGMWASDEEIMQMRKPTPPTWMSKPWDRGRFTGWLSES